MRVHAHVVDGAVRVSVEDSGPGVAHELEDSLFERFTRAGVSRDRVAGTGLGLAIARAYARAHRGDVRYETRPAERRALRGRPAFRLDSGRDGSDLLRARRAGARVPRCRRPRRLAPAPRSSATGTRSSPTGRRPATARCASGSPPATASTCRASSSRTARSRASSSSRSASRAGKRVLVERPTYDRPLKILRELGADVVGLDCDEHGLDPDALEAALRDGDAAGVPLPDPDLPEPERPHAERGAAPADRRARARARPARLRGRPVRARALRGREHCRRCSSSPTATAIYSSSLLEDDRARPPCRLVRVPRAARA